MRVPYSEGLATHTDSESCVYIRKGMGEALTGDVRAGQTCNMRWCGYGRRRENSEQRLRVFTQGRSPVR